jgi:hypothetical protein
MKKMRCSEAPSRTNEFEDPRKELWRNHWALRVARSEILGQISSSK